MKCMGSCADEKVCYLCQTIQPEVYDECRGVAAEWEERARRVREIEAKCPYLKFKYSRDRHLYRACTKTTRDKWGDYEGCVPTLECGVPE